MTTEPQKISEEVVLRTLKCSLNQYPRVLEKRFPHVLKNIVEKWNSPDFSAYVADLLQTNGHSGGRMDRDGFPKDAWQEIYKLAELHRSTHSR